LKKIAPQSFKDVLSRVLICLIAALWILSSLKALELPSEINGALIVTWTLMVQYYFRKKQTAASKE
jgi:hypothetical protein